MGKKELQNIVAQGPVGKLELPKFTKSIYNLAATNSSNSSQAYKIDLQPCAGQFQTGGNHSMLHQGARFKEKSCTAQKHQPDSRAVQDTQQFGSDYGRM